MLSRHFLRCKVLQQVYALHIEPERKNRPLDIFDTHIQRLNELAVIQLSLLPRLADIAGTMLDEGQRKFRPTDEDLNPNRRLVNNEFIRRLRDNFEFRGYMEQWSQLWDMREEMLRETYADLRTQPFFRDYLADPDEGFDFDRDSAIKVFRYLVNREALRDVIGDRSLLWEDDFDQIAQYSYMFLKTLTADNFDEAMMWPKMYDPRVEKDVEDMEFARSLFQNTLSGKEESEQLIRRYLQGWDFERVALMDILLLTMAIAELTSCPTIPEKVTVDEYIELSKEFSSERSKLFINGILDKIVIELRSKGRINKTGRGLYYGEGDATSEPAKGFGPVVQSVGPLDDEK